MTTSDAVADSVLVELLHVPDCPLVDRVRDMLRACLPMIPRLVQVTERGGNYPSPTLLVGGIDVVTGAPPQHVACCRFDLPTRDQILTALHATTHP
ncbi:MAG TPA: alkylmercury lyase [Pseudonocardiaceae bacterium]|nr:alkylmercury lyase [Pseudonocardiaceae bacterium]